MLEQYNILDFETTGFSTDFDRVIEVGVVKIKNNQIVDKFEALINPGMHINSTITGLTGITNNMVRNAETSLPVMKKLNEFVGNELIIAHNASFDSRFFQAEMERAGFSGENKFLCTLLLSRRIYQELGSHKLEYLCRHLGLVNRASHRALGDVEVTFKVFDNLCDRIRQKSGKDEISFDYLGKLSKVPKKKVLEWLTQKN